MQNKTTEELIEAFHMMWDNYPEQVRLINRTFLVLAGNPAYLDAGGKIGVHCNKEGDPEGHRGCRAMAALKAKETRSVKTVFNGVAWESFWVPVAGEDDYYIHFTNGLNEAIAKFAAEQS